MEDSRQQNIISTFLVRLAHALPFVFVFIAALARPSDLDLGWHLKYGEYFFRRGSILRDNIFSAEMQGYQYVNHAWGFDTALYAIYHWLGFAGISIAGAGVVVLIFYFFARASGLTLWEEGIMFPVLMYVTYDNFSFSLRSQMISLLGIGIVYFCIAQFERKNNKAFIWALAPLFMLWANLHGQFILGLAIYGLWALRRWWMHADLRPIGAGALAFAATFINPFGRHLYTEIGRHFGNPLQQYVNEWMPLQWYSLWWWTAIISAVFLCAGIALFYKKKKIVENIHVIVPATLFLMLSFSQRRYLWPAIFVAMPLFGVCVAAARPANKKIAFRAAAIIALSAYLFVSIGKLPQEHIFSMDWQMYCRVTGCSSRSAQYVSQNKLSGHMLTDYNWGGWLIWNHSDIKPTIDGRMPFWRDEYGYSAFEKYVALENNTSDINGSDFDIVYISPGKKGIYERLMWLVDEGKWRIAYHDPFAYIFVRNTR